MIGLVCKSTIKLSIPLSVDEIDALAGVQDNIETQKLSSNNKV